LIWESQPRLEKLLQILKKCTKNQQSEWLCNLGSSQIGDNQSGNTLIGDFSPDQSIFVSCEEP
jgi:hypothetical protein